MMVYNPYLEKYEHEGIRYLLVTHRMITSFAGCLLWAYEVASWHLASDMNAMSNIQNAIDCAELSLSECLRATRTYYEYWLLHHQLRVIILMAMNYDIARMYVELARIREYS